MSGSSATGAGRAREILRLFTPSVLSAFRAGYGRRELKNDLFGGLTAAVVALPLALAFGVSSGAGAVAGLYGAIAVGFFAAVFGGTPSQVSGPTGPMTVVMGAVVASHAGNLAEAFAIVTLGGLLQIVFGLLRVGKYIAYTPYSVISGFMTGIGVIIMLSQALPFIGLPAAQGGALASLSALFSSASLFDARALLLAALSLAVIVLWPKKWRAVFPAPLAVLVAGTAAAVFLLPGLPEIGPVPQGLPGLSLAAPSAHFPQVFQAAFVLALLGGIDSLLTSLIADSITHTRHDPDKELVGQGIGNAIAGLIGGLPGAGATMRTLVNIRSGGHTGVSGAAHALVLLGLALGLGPLVAHVPHCVLAAILMKVGWDIIDWGYLRRMRKAPGEKFFIMLVTFALTVFVDLITAVAVGIILASFVTSRWLAEEQLKGIRHSNAAGDLGLAPEEQEMLRPIGDRVLLTLLTGSFSYASARELGQRANAAVMPQSVVIYDFTQAGYIDTSAALAIEEMLALAAGRGKKILVAGLTGRALMTLDGLGVLRRVPEDCRFATRAEAIAAAARAVNGAPSP